MSTAKMAPSRQKFITHVLVPILGEAAITSAKWSFFSDQLAIQIGERTIKFAWVKRSGPWRVRSGILLVPSDTAWQGENIDKLRELIPDWVKVIDEFRDVPARINVPGYIEGLLASSYGIAPPTRDSAENVPLANAALGLALSGLYERFRGNHKRSERFLSLFQPGDGWNPTIGSLRDAMESIRDKISILGLGAHTDYRAEISWMNDFLQSYYELTGEDLVRSALLINLQTLSETLPIYRAPYLPEEGLEAFLETMWLRGKAVLEEGFEPLPPGDGMLYANSVREAQLQKLLRYPSLDAALAIFKDSDEEISELLDPRSFDIVGYLSYDAPAPALLAEAFLIHYQFPKKQPFDLFHAPAKSLEPRLLPPPLDNATGPWGTLIQTAANSMVAFTSPELVIEKTDRGLRGKRILVITDATSPHAVIENEAKRQLYNRGAHFVRIFSLSSSPNIESRKRDSDEPTLARQGTLESRKTRRRIKLEEVFSQHFPSDAEDLTVARLERILEVVSREDSKHLLTQLVHRCIRRQQRSDYKILLDFLPAFKTRYGFSGKEFYTATKRFLKRASESETPLTIEDFDSEQSKLSLRGNQVITTAILISEERLEIAQLSNVCESVPNDRREIFIEKIIARTTTPNLETENADTVLKYLMDPISENHLTIAARIRLVAKLNSPQRRETIANWLIDRFEPRYRSNYLLIANSLESLGPLPPSVLDRIRALKLKPTVAWGRVCAAILGVNRL